MPLPGLSGAAAERYGTTPSFAGRPMPYKFNEPRRHKIPRARYRVQNWPEYDRALQRRGDLTVWVTPAAVAADRGPAALPHRLARPGVGHPRPHHVLAAQPGPGAGQVAGASAGGWRAGARGDRCDRAEGLRRGRMAGAEAGRAWQAHLAEAAPRGGLRHWRDPRLRADRQRGRRRLPGRPFARADLGPPRFGDRGRGVRW